MDKLRVLLLAFVFGLVCAPAWAQLTTVGPNTSGVTEFNVEMVQKGTCGLFNRPCWFPTFTPIQPLQPGGQGDDFYSMAALGGGCFHGCPTPSQSVNPEGPAASSMFDISFHTAKPVTTVVALQMGLSIGPTFGSTVDPEVLAFDGQRLVASCIVMNVGAGCFSDAKVEGTLGGIPVAWSGNLTVSAPDITSVWIGSAAFGGGGAEGIQFGTSSVPEPGALALFALALSCLGLARSRGASYRTSTPLASRL